MFGVLELRGDFRLVQEAHKRVGGVEYHFQGDGALGGGLARTEDRARAALCDDHAEVLFFPQKLLGQSALHHRGAGRGRHVGGLVPQPPQLDRCGADLDLPVRPQARASVFRNGLAARRRRAANLRRVMRMMRMKGGDVEIKNVPNMPSAGGVDPKATFGKMLEVQHQVAADAQFDDLGTAAPKVLPPAGGRRRTKKKTLKHKKKGHGSRTKHRRVRKYRGSSLRTLRVRRHRR